MSIKQIKSVFFSPVFHSRDLARALAQDLAAKLGLAAPKEHDITNYPQNRNITEFGPDDLVILSAPVYGGRLPAPAPARFGQFRGNGARAVLLASYGNRAYEDALLELADIARDCGFKTIAGAACIAAHTIAPNCAPGRPDQADLDSLKKFSAAIADLLAKNPESPKIPGNRPYKEFTPNALPQSVDDNCTHCGLCSRDCPTLAIDPEDQSKLDKAKCICCMRCVNICPVHARHADPGFIKMISEKLAPLCAKRKENEYFLP